MSFLFILPVCLGYLSPLGNNHLSALAALSLTVFVLLLNIEFFNIFWTLAAHQMYYLQVFSSSFWLLSLHFLFSLKWRSFSVSNISTCLFLLSIPMFYAVSTIYAEHSFYIWEITCRMCLSYSGLFFLFWWSSIPSVLTSTDYQTMLYLQPE